MSESTFTPAIELDEVVFRWPGRSAFTLTVPRLEIERGSKVLLLGESGSGKSTLSSLICGIIVPQSGRVVIDGVDIRSLSGSDRDRFRADRIGVIFQQFNLLPYASPLDNVLLPLRFSPERRSRIGDARAEALRLADALSLPRAIMELSHAATSSVGQQQRIAVARAIIGAPPLIVADEPTSALDASSQAAFLGLLFDQCEAAGTTLLMVSHDERLAGRFDRSIRIEDVASVERENAA